MAKKATTAVREAKDVVNVVPVGNQVLVERLTEGEILGSSLVVSVSQEPSNQAFVLALGPQVNKDNGIKVGDRVLLQGSFVPVPKFDTSSRQKNLVLPDMIKAVLTEE